MMKTIFLTVNTKQEDNISDDEDNIFYGEDKTRGKETLRNVVGERKLRRVFPATLYDGDDDGDDDGGGDLENWVNIFVYYSDNNIYFSAEGKRGKSFTGGKHLTQIGEAEKYETTTFQKKTRW